MRRRRIFAEVDRFLLYDFERDDGSVDENVFVYSNEVDGERSLVVYHNRHAATRGSNPAFNRGGEEPHNPDRPLVRTTLGDGLRLSDGADTYLIMRDAVTGLEFLKSCRQLRDDGMRLDLGAYQLHCFVALREVVSDEEHPWAELATELDGVGVRSLDEALGVRVMAPILDPIRRLLETSTLRDLAVPETSSRRHRAAAGERGSKKSIAIVAAAAEPRRGLQRFAHRRRSRDAHRPRGPPRPGPPGRRTGAGKSRGSMPRPWRRSPTGWPGPSNGPRY